MNEQKLKNFIELVTFDQKFTDLEQRIHASNSTTEVLHKQLQQLERDLEQYESKYKDTQKQLHEQELKVKELQDRETHQAQLSNAVSTTKEYEASNKETDRIKFDRNQQEQRLVQMTNKMVAIDKDYQAVQVQYTTEKTALSDSITHEQTVVVELEKELVDLHKVRDEKLVDVPAEWLRTYETMRGRVSNPVVPVSQDSCSACFYFMSSCDMQSLRHNGLMQCKDCYRFLYQEQAS